MTVSVCYEAEEKLDLDYETIIRDVVAASLDFENCPYEAEVNVLLTGLDEIHEMNQSFRGVDRPTDVLSFPMIEYETPGDFSFLEEDDDAFDPENGELVLGDIVICVRKVKEQAALYGHSEKRELAFLTAHSMLHLMGYDHMEDGERLVMEEKQRKILENLHIER